MRNTKKACIATFVLAIAVLVAPTSTARCVGDGQPPSWWPNGTCTVQRTPPQSSLQDSYFCVSDNPFDCLP